MVSEVDTQQKKPSDRVADQPAASLVFLALVVSALLGLAVRIYFSSNQIKIWVDEAIRAKELARLVDVQEANLVLADGFFPLVAVDLKKVSGRWESACGLSGWWNADQIRVPLKFADLLRGRAVLDELRVHFLEVHLEPSALECPSRRSPASPANVPRNQPKGRRTVSTAALVDSEQKQRKEQQERLRTLLQKGWSDAQGGLAKLSEETRPSLWVEEMRVFVQTQADMTYLLGDLRVASRVGEQPEVSVEGRASLAVGGRSRPETQFTLKVSPENAQLVYKGRWLEGVFSGKLGLSTMGAEKLNWWWQTDIQHLSLKNIVSLVGRQQKILSHIQPRFAWLSCRLNGQGQLEDETSAIAVQDCAIDGDLGHLEIKDLNFGTAYVGGVSPYVIRLGQVSLGEVLKAFQLPQLGSLGNYGKIVGDIQVQRADRISWRGAIQDVSFVFSNLGVQAQQNVSEVYGKVDILGDRIEGVFDEMRMSEGRVRGGIEFVVDRKTASGQLRVDFPEIELAPRIQTLMFAGEAKGLGFSGDFELAKGAVAKGQGRFLLDSLRAETMLVAGARVTWTLEGQVMNLEPTLQSFEIHRSSKYYRLLSNFWGVGKFDQDWMAWSILAGRVTMNRDEVKWVDLHAKSSVGALDVMASGGWDSEGALSGQFRVKGSGGLLKLWDLGGERDSPMFNVHTQPLFKSGPQGGSGDGQAHSAFWERLYQVARQTIRVDESPGK